jgi:hypothetical protein
MNVLLVEGEEGKWEENRESARMRKRGEDERITRLRRDMLQCYIGLWHNKGKERRKRSGYEVRQGLRRPATAARK